MLIPFMGGVMSCSGIFLSVGLSVVVLSSYERSGARLVLAAWLGVVATLSGVGAAVLVLTGICEAQSRVVAGLFCVLFCIGGVPSAVESLVVVGIKRLSPAREGLALILGVIAAVVTVPLGLVASEVPRNIFWP